MDTLNLNDVVSVEPGVSGKSVMMMLVEVEAIDGKIVGSALSAGYHIDQCALPGRLNYTITSPIDREKCPK